MASSSSCGAVDPSYPDCLVRTLISNVGSWATASEVHFGQAVDVSGTLSSGKLENLAGEIRSVTEERGESA